MTDGLMAVPPISSVGFLLGGLALLVSAIGAGLWARKRLKRGLDE